MSSADTKSYTLLRNADINGEIKRATETVSLTADDAAPFLAVGVIVEAPIEAPGDAVLADAVAAAETPAEETSLFSETQSDFTTD